MTRSKIQTIHIADGFADDCEELIHRWMKTDMLTYETFCEIWKDMGFAYLYHGRQTGSEMAELTEEMIFVAKHYMVDKSSNCEESVAGLFLVYALLNLQPYAKFAPLRLEPDDVPAIHKIQTMATKQKRYDVLYILGSVLVDGPTQYHAAARERGMEIGLRKYLEGCSSVDTPGARPRGVFHRQNEELDLMRELRCVTNRYVQAKEAISGSAKRDLSYLNPNFSEEMDASLKRLVNGKTEGTDDSEISDVENSVQAIKDKAMKLRVDGMRHLQTTVGNNSSPKKTSPRKSVCEIKQKPGRVTQRSPRKPVTPRTKLKTSGRMRKRKQISSSSSDDSDQSWNSDSSDESNKDVKEKTEDITTKKVEIEDNDINIDLFDKETKECDATEEKEIEISIESLPILIREEQLGKMIEIEIIDNLKPKTKVVKAVNPKEKLLKLSEVSWKKVHAEEGTVEDSGSSKVTQLAEIKKIPKDEAGPSRLLVRPEKRDLKKVVVKSKLKKMGLLDVVDGKKKSGKNDTGE